MNDSVATLSTDDAEVANKSNEGSQVRHRLCNVVCLAPCAIAGRDANANANIAIATPTLLPTPPTLAHPIPHPTCIHPHEKKKPGLPDAQPATFRAKAQAS